MSEYIITDKQLGLIEDFATVCVEGEKLERIVRCRDCKFCHKNYCEKRTSPTVSPSEIHWIPVEPDGFCAWGERREP